MFEEEKSRFFPRVATDSTGKQGDPCRIKTLTFFIKKRQISDSFNQPVGYCHQRVTGVIEHLHIIKCFVVHRVSSPFHAQFDILLDFDDIGIEGCYPKTFCCYRTVMAVRRG